MQKIYTHQALWMVINVKNLLETARITAELRNEYAAGGVGELSFIDAWPELWVSYEDVAVAKKIIADFAVSAEEKDWQCICGEINGPAFAACWACGRDRSRQQR